MLVNTLRWFLLGAMLILPGCAESTAPIENILTVQARHETTLFANPAVTGVGEGRCDDRPCLLVFVETLRATSVADIPTQLDGYEVRLIESGMIQPQDDNMTDQEQQLQKIQAANEDAWLAIPGVVGVGIGECQDQTPCLKVLVEAKDEAIEASIPKTVDGVPVEIEEVGVLQSLDVSDTPASMETVMDVQAKHEDSLLAIDGVVGVGVGECAGNPCLQILVNLLTPELKQALPTELDGVAVDTIEVGDIQIQPEQ